MPSFMNRQGVWMRYDYNTIPYLIEISMDVVPLTRVSAKEGFGRIGFLPFDMPFAEAVDWWERRGQIEDETEELANSHVYFLGSKLAACEHPELVGTDFVKVMLSEEGITCEKCVDILEHWIKP